MIEPKSTDKKMNELLEEFDRMPSLNRLIRYGFADMYRLKKLPVDLWFVKKVREDNGKTNLLILVIG